MPFASSLVDVLLVESESEIFAIFLLYVYINKRPAAFNVHGLINVSMLGSFFSLIIMCAILSDASIISADEDWRKHLLAIFAFFRQSF